MLRKAGCEVEKRKMQYADVMFPANGPNGTVCVGIELKKPGDLVTSLVDKRYTSRQLPGMQKTFDEVVLAIVGHIQRSTTGGIAEYRMGSWRSIPTSMSWRQLEARKMSLRYKQGVTIVEFVNDDHFVEWIVAASEWWARPWDSHTSHIKTHVAYRTKDLIAPLIDPTHSFEQANLLPGIGIETAKKISQVFMTPGDMAAASLEDWKKVPGMTTKKAGACYLWFRERR